jgi:glycosyltransferase involved in cell wall biosynthesis
VRVCIVYDCLYPHTIGGAERWYRGLAEALHERGHEVTYLTLRQWGRHERPGVPGVTVVAVGPRLELYRRGRRGVVPPLRFGLGVLWHLARHGRRFDVVHTASFPYFSLLAAAAVRPLGGYRLAVDWFEVWTPGYWAEYLGPRAGRVGWRVQRLCLGPRQQAFCFSELAERRLLAEGVNGPVTRLGGIVPRRAAQPRTAAAEPRVVFAGRLIPEKRVLAVVPAVALASERIPGLRCDLYGDGPDRPELLRAIRASGLSAVVRAPGFVPEAEVEQALGSALCLILPSRREGYGRVVVEAAAHGTPSVLVRGEDNAAAELVEDGVNGFVAPSASADDLAAAIVRVHAAGEALRASTAAWYAANAERLSLERALETVLAHYPAPSASTQSSG